MTILNLLTRSSPSGTKGGSHSCSHSSHGHQNVETEVLPVPMVHVRLSELGAVVHSILERNDGCIRLKSVFSTLEGSLDTNSQPSVSLEHLLSCIKGVKIVTSRTEGAKYLKWSDESVLELEMSRLSFRGSFTPEKGFASQKSINFGSEKGINFGSTEMRSGSRRGSYSTMDESTRMLINFGREVRGMLKSQTGCMIPFSKFIPCYHSHFGKQCCLQPYGFERLVDLIEAVPNVVQIIANQKMITLTHREQTKRFASDLIRVLKTRTEKRLLVSEIKDAFEEVFEKSVNPSDYGVCYFEDILADVWEGTILRNRNEAGELVSIEVPVRERTAEEKYRTKLFVRDVIELFRTCPNFSMEFSKFIPRYHHHFRKQCRVADYGFSKLADLLASISPHTVEVIKRGNNSGDADDDLIVLSERIRRRFVLERIHDIIRRQRGGRTHPRLIYQTYQYRYGTDLSRATTPAIKVNSLIRGSNSTVRTNGSNNYSRSRTSRYNNSYNSHNNSHNNSHSTRPRGPVRGRYNYHSDQFPQEVIYTKILQRPIVKLSTSSQIPQVINLTTSAEMVQSLNGHREELNDEEETRSTTSTVVRKRRMAINFDDSSSN